MSEGWNKQVIKCTDIEQNLIDLLDGSIDGERRVDFESHLKDCPTCRQLLATYQPLFDRLSDVPQSSCRANSGTNCKTRLTAWKKTGRLDSTCPCNGGRLSPYR